MSVISAALYLLFMLTILHTTIVQYTTIDPDTIEVFKSMTQTQAHKYIILDIVKNIVQPVYVAGPKPTHNKQQDEVEFIEMMGYLPANAHRFVVYNFEFAGDYSLLVSKIAFITWYMPL